jgi:hypothetical protein
MKGSDINRALLIFILFGLLYLVNILSVGIKRIKEQWPIYRCNPAIMPFAGIFGKDPINNFVGCIQNMQSLNMDYLLKPIKYNIKLLSDIGGQFNENLAGVRGFLSKFREKILEITGMIYSILSGLITEFQIIIAKIKDMVSKLAGALVVILYTIEGTVITGKSIHNLLKKIFPKKF